MMSLAVQNMGMYPEEVWSAVTINAAHAVALDAQIGSLKKGKAAHLVIWDMPSYLFPFYHFGKNFVEQVIIGGKLIL